MRGKQQSGGCIARQQEGEEELWQGRCNGTLARGGDGLRTWDVLVGRVARLQGFRCHGVGVRDCWTERSRHTYATL